MNKNKNQHNIFKAKYFYMITLLFAWLIAAIFSFDSNLETYQSLQLSSDSAGAQTNKPNPYATSTYKFNPYTLPYSTTTQYRVELEVVKSQLVTIQSSGKTELLNRGDVVLMTVPGFALGGKIDPIEVDLESVIKKANIVEQGKEPFGGYINEVDIVKAKNEDLLSESTRLRLALMAKNKEVRIKSIEFEEEDETAVQDSEGDVCQNGDCNQSSIAGTSILETFNKLILKTKDDLFAENKYTGPKTMSELIESYENSSTVRDLTITAKRGYRAVRRNGRGEVFRSTSVSSFRKSGSIGACYNGVKELLQRSGVTRTRLAGEHAKNAGSSLNKQGFLNLLKTDYKNKIKSPYDAPVGSIIVYGGKGSGHIEVKTENGFISDYYSPNARTGARSAGLRGKGRTVIGIYIKETNEVKNYLAYQESLRNGGKNEI